MLSNYQEITKLVESDFINLEKHLKKVFQEINNPLSKDLAGYIFSKSKRIRSLLIFLVVKSLKIETTSDVISIAAATELIHNATLIHDDIIDDSEKRRGMLTLNYKYNNKLAVIAGDYLLSLAIKQLEEVKPISVTNVFSSSLEKICNGEIIQFFGNNKIPSIDSYIEKSKLKTAILFDTAISSTLIACEKKEFLNEFSDFAINFGIAFQIRDDLINFLNLGTNKSAQEDFKNGTYTAPIIYLCKENKNIVNLPVKDILNTAKTTSALAKSFELFNTHIERALKNLDFLEDNKYKKALIDLCHNIREVK